MPGGGVVFPAYAGMSLTLMQSVALAGGFPRLRGDEPRRRETDRRRPNVFPAYAGMSLRRGRRRASVLRFPRLRGDEPHTPPPLLCDPAFSPPTRG